jgi:UTP-glucose-1-phosphate uridylyltransferase
MDEIRFNSIEELYQRIKPALSSKAHELHTLGYKYINEQDIFDYLKENRWNKAKNLTLAEMIDDIFMTKNDDYNAYVVNVLNAYRLENPELPKKENLL